MLFEMSNSSEGKLANFSDKLASFFNQTKVEIALLVTLLLTVTAFYWLSFGNLDLDFILFVWGSPFIIIPLSFFFVRLIDGKLDQDRLIELLCDCDAYRSRFTPEETSQGKLSDEMLCGVFNLAKIFQSKDKKYIEMVEMMAHLIRESKPEFYRVIGLSVVKKEGDTFSELYREGNCTGEMFSPIAYDLGKSYTTLYAYRNPESNTSDEQLSFEKLRDIRSGENVILIAGILTDGHAILQAVQHLRKQIANLKVEEVFVYILQPSGSKKDQVMELLREAKIKVHFIAEASEIYKKLREFGKIEEEELAKNLECLKQ